MKKKTKRPNRVKKDSWNNISKKMVDDEFGSNTVKLPKTGGKVKPMMGHGNIFGSGMAFDVDDKYRTMWEKLKDEVLKQGYGFVVEEMEQLERDAE